MVILFSFLFYVMLRIVLSSGEDMMKAAAEELLKKERMEQVASRALCCCWMTTTTTMMLMARRDLSRPTSEFKRPRDTTTSSPLEGDALNVSDVCFVCRAPRVKPNFTFKFKIALGMLIVPFDHSNNTFDTRQDSPRSSPTWTYPSRRHGAVEALLCKRLTTCIRPADFKTFVSWLSPANLDFVQISNVGCAQSFTFYTKLVTFCVFPIACLVIIFLVCVRARAQFTHWPRSAIVIGDL